MKFLPIICWALPRSSKRGERDEREIDVLGNSDGCFLGRHPVSELELVGVTVYTSKQLCELLNISDNTARSIMQEYGFRTGNKPKSPLRITEEGVREWADSQRMTTASPRTQ